VVLNAGVPIRDAEGRSRLWDLHNELAIPACLWAIAACIRSVMRGHALQDKWRRAPTRPLQGR
jgi:hypothetical protein